MSKWLSLGLVVVMIAVGSIFAFKIIHQPKQIEHLESLIPDNALYYVYSYNPNKKISDFSSSQFYKKISSLPIYKKYLKPELEKLKEKTFFLQNIFSNDSALAVFSTGNIVDSNEGLGRSKLGIGDFLLLTSLDLKSIKKTLKDLHETLSKDRVSTFKKYKGIKITTYIAKEGKKNKLSVDFVLLGNVLISSNKHDLVLKSIDLFKEDSQDSLMNDEIFKKVTGNYNRGKKDVLLWTYTNYKEYYKSFFASLAKKNLKEGDFSIEKGIQFGKYRDFVKNFTDMSIGMFASLDYAPLKEGLVWRGYQFFDKTKDKTNILDMFSSSAKASETAGLVPFDTVFYFGLSGNATKYWNYFKSLLMIAQELNPTQEEMTGQSFYENPFMALGLAELFLGVNLEKDILPLLGTNFAGVLSTIEEIIVELPQGSAAGKMPFVMPEFSIIIQAKDKDKAEQLRGIITEKIIPKLNSLLKVQAAVAREREEKKEEMISQMQDETANEAAADEVSQDLPEPIEDMLKIYVKNYKGYDIHELSIRDFHLTPSCFVVDDYLVISSSTKYAKKTITVKKGLFDSLDSHLNQELISEAMLSNYSFIYYFDLASLIEQITKTKMFMAAKPFAMMASRGKLTGEDIDSVIDILNDISLLVNTYKMTDEAIGESLMYIKIEGLQ